MLHNSGSKGVVAVVVYPLNALINSQSEEFEKYKKKRFNATGRDFPITFNQYTGQEDEISREKMRSSPPQILLTNYMMLELLLTRTQERSIRDAIYENLRYLVFDELHTYRGRQGSDVAMLIRRIRAQCKHPVSCVGTSATMVSGGTVSEQRKKVAEVATTLFGKRFDDTQVVNETLDLSLDPGQGLPSEAALSKAIRAGIHVNANLAALRQHPIPLWLEAEAALEQRGETLVRRKPQSVGVLAKRLSDASHEFIDACVKTLTDTLLWISTVNEAIQRRDDRNTVLPFRLHQFISQTGFVYTTLDQGENRFITLEPGIYKADEFNEKPIYPNVFSRTSGHPFICVTRAGNKLLPREFLDNSEDEDQNEDGYLLVGDDVWDPDQDLDFLPYSWFRTSKRGRVPLPEKAEFFPQLIHFDELGTGTRNQPHKISGLVHACAASFRSDKRNVF